MNDSLKIAELLKKVILSKDVISAMLSGPFDKTHPHKIGLRIVLIKGVKVYQLSEYISQQVLHRNLSAEECLEWFDNQFKHYKQTYLYTSLADYHLLLSQKGKMTLLTKAPSKKIHVVEHNRTKDYLLQEGAPIPFLVELKIMNNQGRVYPQKMDKFRQINRFIEMIDDILEHLDLSKPLRIIDFGCGKAYLTFALHYFLKTKCTRAVFIVGLDLKEQVIKDCQKLAKSLNCESEVQFVLGDIQNYTHQDDVDLVVSLHACDTATDMAIEKAVRWNARVILAVPCCQHEVNGQIHQELLHPLLKHGILKERFAALVTDAARAQLLDILGYQTQILEFIDMEHTPKNLLIRAVKRKSSPSKEKALAAYQLFKQHLHIHPFLENFVIS